jgi:hypothetical protein
MGVMLGDLEEIDRLSEGISAQTGLPEHRIGKGYREGGALGPQGKALGLGLPFDFIKGAKLPVGIPLQEFDPAVEALALRQNRSPYLLGDLKVGDVTEFGQRPVFHAPLLGRRAIRAHPATSSTLQPGKRFEEPAILRR